jgi:hypothetical protein
MASAIPAAHAAASTAFASARPVAPRKAKPATLGRRGLQEIKKEYDRGQHHSLNPLVPQALAGPSHVCGGRR